MPNAINTEDLRRAADLIERVLVQLDTRHTTCTQCKSKHFSDTTQFRVYERLSDTPEKLRAMADKLEGSPNGNRI